MFKDSRLWIAIFIPVLASSCIHHVSIVERGSGLAQAEPVQGAVHDYPGSKAPELSVGPFVTIYLSTEADLEPLAREWTHHLSFILLPCSDARGSHSLYTGTVFAANEDERANILGASASSEQHLYKVHIPLDLARITNMASVQGDLDVPQYLEVARRDGLCLMLEGGQMWGDRLVSNLVHAPVAISDNALVVVTEGQEGR